MLSYSVGRGTAIIVSRRGEPFVVYVTTKDQHFWKFLEEDYETLTFANKGWLLRVPKAAVTTWDHANLT